MDNSITSKSDKNKLYLDANLIKSAVEKILPNLFRYLAFLGIHPPVWFFVTLTNVKGLEIYPTKYMRLTGANRQIDRDDLYLPEVRIDDLSSYTDIYFEPLYEMIWNAGGWEAPRF